MRCEIVLVAACAGGCAIRLDELPAHETPAPEAPPVQAGCALLADGPERGAEGRAFSVPHGDGRLWGVETLVTASGRLERAGVEMANDSDVCTLAASPFSPLLFDQSDHILAAVDAARSGDELFVSFDEQGVGFGIVTGLGAVTPEPLWSADRPSFGVALVVEQGRLYAYGCKAAGFLSGECFVARAPTEDVGSPAAWEYYQGGGNYSANVDDAWPIVEASTSIDVHYDPARDRFVMLYVPVLGDTIFARTGLGPSGPWSNAYAVARCALPEADRGAFCGGVRAHPGVGAGGLLVSYAIGSFDRTAPQSSYRTRAATVELPAELP